jgi:release factor glutamine methyltransferase
LIDYYGDAEAGNISDLVMEKITGWEKRERIENKTVPFSVMQEKLFYEMQGRLINHEPVQYVTGEAWFCGMKFRVDPSVLIPRPETEELVDWIYRDLKEKISSIKLLDVGTGSGCIAISLRKKLAKLETWACDTSSESLMMARTNADELQALVDFIELDFLSEEEQKQLPVFDMIVSNPPYIPISERDEMSRHVKDFEPEIALFVPDNDALIFYRAIAAFGKNHLSENGAVYLEIHESLGSAVMALLEENGYRHVELKKDMQGKDRMVKAAK